MESVLKRMLQQYDGSYCSLQSEPKQRVWVCVADLLAANGQGSPVSPQGSADTILRAPAINPLCMAGDQAVM